jgi:hypothetical protein
MNRVFKRFYGHDRTIQCLITKNSVIYKIPIYFEEEQKVLGNYLELQLDLNFLQKEIRSRQLYRSSDCCSDKNFLHKTLLSNKDSETLS